MVAGDVTVFVQSVDKVDGTEIIASNIYSSTVLLGTTRDIQTTVFPRKTTGQVTTYDIITTVTELS